MSQPADWDDPNLVPGRTPSPEVLAVLQRAVGFSTDGAARLEDIINGTAVYEFRGPDGALQGAMTLQLYAGGRALRCTAAGSVGPGVDVLPAMLEHGQSMARYLGVEVMTITTRRRGLVRKMQQAGFEIGGYVMRKKI